MTVKDSVKISRKKIDNELINKIIDSLEDKKANNILLIDFRRKGNGFSDFFVICDAESTTKMRALINNVDETISKSLTQEPLFIEGNEESGWMLVDYGEVVVHVFLTEQRQTYDLEGLWADADRVQF